jgi:hypothetical protein
MEGASSVEKKIPSPPPVHLIHRFEETRRRGPTTPPLPPSPFLRVLGEGGRRGVPSPGRREEEGEEYPPSS